MSAQGSMNAITGAVTGSIVAATKIAEGLNKKEDVKAPKADKGIDMKMAAKARKTFQQKANAIYMNKEISNKAKTRRLGAALDEYNKTMGGKQ